MTVQVATDLSRIGRAELAATIRSGRTSSREVVEAHLRRIEAVNPTVNADALRFLVAFPRGVVEGMPWAVPNIAPRLPEDPCLDAAEAIETRVGVLTTIDPR